MKILIAEDQPASALLLRRLLERLGQEVTVVNDGEKAWQVVQQMWFPLIISDWVMPGMDGLELCRLVRKQFDRSYTYLILLTSKQSLEERLEGLRAGADDFLTKPLNSQELAVRLEIASRILKVQDELERRNRLLGEMAHSDELTGLHNRRRFREMLDVEFMLAIRSDLPLSLVMIDVDQFKQYNDAFGHPKGDEVLQTVANLLRDGVQKVGEVARYGGEEFVILLPNMGMEAAKDLANRLRESLERTTWPLRPITASFGIATSSPDSFRIDLLVGEADLALYRSKREGRNRVTHFLDPEPVFGTEHRHSVTSTTNGS